MQAKSVGLGRLRSTFFTVFEIFENRSRESRKGLVGDYSDMIVNCKLAEMISTPPDAAPEVHVRQRHLNQAPFKFISYQGVALL